MATTTLVILLLNVFSTWFMVGVIWFVQIVHYPLFGRVDAIRFVEYQRQHQRRTTWLVAPAMLIEAFSSVLLVWYPPIHNTPLLLIGVGLLFVIWTSTVVLQIPCQGELDRGFNPSIHRQLVLANWIRTVAWTLRGSLVGAILSIVIANAADLV